MGAGTAGASPALALPAPMLQGLPAGPTKAESQTTSFQCLSPSPKHPSNLSTFDFPVGTPQLQASVAVCTLQEFFPCPDMKNKKKLFWGKKGCEWVRGALPELPVTPWTKLMVLGAAGSVLCWTSLVGQRWVPGCSAPHPGSPSRLPAETSCFSALCQTGCGTGTQKGDAV